MFSKEICPIFQLWNLILNPLKEIYTEKQYKLLKLAGMLSGKFFSAKLNDVLVFTFVPSIVIICKKNRLDILEFTPRDEK